MGWFRRFFSQKLPVSDGKQTFTNVSGRSLPQRASQETSPGPRTAQSGSPHYFEALSETNDRTPIPVYALAARAALQSFSREKLASLGRYLYNNDGNVSYAVDQIANYSVPIIPMAATKDANANRVYEDYFDEWAKRADYSGRFHFGVLQRIICKSFDTDGDILPMFNAAHGFPQLQLFETWRVNSRSVEGAGHVDGVAVDGEGVVRGYYVVNASVVSGRSTTPPQFIPADQAILLYDPDHYSSYRGLTPIRRGMNDVRDAKDIKGFSKLATKIGAALAAVIEGADLEEENVWSNDSGNEDGTIPGNTPPADATPQERKFSTAELLGGDIPILPEGRKLNQLDNKQPGERVMEMLDYLGGCFISGLGVPSAFFLFKKMTGPNQRGVNGQAQRKFDQRQAVIAAFVEWVWVRVVAWGITHDGLPAVEGWNRIEWQGPSKVSIDEGADATAWRDDVACGLMTRQEHFSNRARNWQRETDQGFAEDDYILTKANELATKQNVPVELILARWGYTAAKAQAGPADDPQDPNSDETDTPTAN